MNLRFNHYNVHPEVYKLMSTFEQWVRSSSLDKELYEIVKIRASQINGCAFCLDMHSTDFRKLGDNEQRVVLIGVWRESPFFSDRERAALELTEAVTEISKGGVSDALYNRVREHFSEKEYMELIMAINVINNWNRIAISTGMYPGYQNAK